MTAGVRRRIVGPTNRYHQRVPEFGEQLDWIDAQAAAMRERVTDLASINSGSLNLEGLARVGEQLAAMFSELGGRMRTVPLPPMSSIDGRGREIETPLGDALLIEKRPDAARRVLLCIHTDTVYGPAHPFQSVTQPDDNTLRGPGVADAKGGIVVMLTALRAFEQSPVAADVGWDVLLNPDEELGSPGSLALLRDAAKRNDFSLLFEPALPDGALAAPRKGSGNFTVVVRGQAAHVGRHFDHGRNAIHLLADLIGQLNDLNHRLRGVTLSVGRVEGGGPLNVVPDLAIARFNVRVTTPRQQEEAEAAIGDIVEAANMREGYHVHLHGWFSSPPKPLDKATESILAELTHCGQVLDVPIRWQPTGGVCDGNKLAAAGLPNVDTLGPRGGDIHSDREFILLDSLTERAKLTALLLLRYASGQWRPPDKTHE